MTQTVTYIFIFSHVAATAAGNYGVPVVLNGFYYGRASGNVGWRHVHGKYLNVLPCALLIVHLTDLCDHF